MWELRPLLLLSHFFLLASEYLSNGAVGFTQIRHPAAFFRIALPPRISVIPSEARDPYSRQHCLRELHRFVQDDDRWEITNLNP
jgi:hypothetical protein